MVEDVDNDMRMARIYAAIYTLYTLRDGVVWQNK